MKNSISTFLKKIVRYIINFFTRSLYIIMRIFPIDKTKIVFVNYYGKGYGDNGKYIAESLIDSQNCLDLVWCVNDINDNDFPNEIRKVKYKSIRYIYEMSTAKVWIDNTRKNQPVLKRKGQYYIQTWHGGIALKQIEKDVQDKLSCSYVNDAKKDSKLADYFISNSSFCTNMYRNSFWYYGKILEVGYPRCDILVNENIEIVNKIKKKLNINSNVNIFLYAPTFRNSGEINIYNINFNRVISKLENKFGGDWNILVRLHPNISNKSEFIRYSDKVINVSDYSDMYELLAVTDILMTDFSSTMFEFALRNKPIFLYAPDIKSYKEERNFYFDLYELPFSISEDLNELEKNLEKFNKEKYEEENIKFFNNINSFDSGKASMEVANLVMQLTMKK